jgi:hypothetical protein
MVTIINFYLVKSKNPKYINSRGSMVAKLELKGAMVGYGL